MKLGADSASSTRIATSTSNISPRGPAPCASEPARLGSAASWWSASGVRSRRRARQSRSPRRIRERSPRPWAFIRTTRSTLTTRRKRELRSSARAKSSPPSARSGSTTTTTTRRATCSAHVVRARSIGLARELDKPIVVHTREAPDDTLAILDGEGAREVGGIIHCFSEDETFARRALELGFDISFSGIVTFKNARDVAAVAASAPVDRIHVETDSPYLAPVPMRGKPCEPAYVVHTAKRVAELRKTTLEELAPILRKNAERRFGRSFG